MTVKGYYKNNQIMFAEHFVNDTIKVGDHHYWHENGSPAYFVSFNQQGEVSGRVIEWRVDGSLRSIIGYKNGVEDGYWTHFYSNGKVSSQGYYKWEEGDENLPVTIKVHKFHPDDEMGDTETYRKPRNGAWHYYNKSGEKIRTEIYEDHEIIEVTHY